MTRSFFENISFKKEIALIALFLSFYILNSWYSHYDFSLQHVQNLFISEATLDGVDISQRISFFYQSIVFGILLNVFLYCILYVSFAYMKFSSYNLQIPMLASSTGIFLIIVNIYGIETTKSVTFLLLVLLLIILLFIFSKNIKSLRYLAQPNCLALLITLSLILMTMLSFLLNSFNWIVQYYNLCFFILTVLICVAVVILKKAFNLLTSALFSYLKFVAVIPILIFISIESFFYFKIHFNYQLNIQWLFMATFISIGVMYLIYHRLKLRVYSNSHILKYYFIPSAILCYLLLTIYNPIVQQPSEFYELANITNSQMRFWKFHEIPFVDFMSSHMLSEQYYGFIYHAIFGYKANYDFMVYSFVETIFFYFSLYYFCNKVFKHTIITLLFLISFPFIHILFGHSLYYLVFLFFIIQRVLNKQSTINYLAILSIILFGIFWRLDVGSASVFTAVIYFPILIISEKIQLDYKCFFKAVGIFIAILLVIFIGFTTARSMDGISGNLLSALHYITGNQAHGYSALSREVNQQFYFFHFMIPLLSIGCILFIIYYKIKSLSTSIPGDSLLLRASLFFYLVVLANFQRGLVRHGFMEANDNSLVSTFYLATALLVLYFVQTKDLINKYVVFYGIAFSLIILLSHFPLAKEETMMEKYLSAATLPDLDSKLHDKNLVGRMMITDSSEFFKLRSLHNFLNTHLDSNQTFLDFSNSPSLYYSFQRKIPSYFCQSLQNTIDVFTQKDHLKRMNPKNVPIVIFSNQPNSWFDATDGVPNAMRYYYLAEYIYANYKPYAIISGKSIWVANEKDFDNSKYQLDATSFSIQIHDYKKASYIMNNYYSSNSYQNLKLLQSTTPVKDSLSNHTIHFSDTVDSAKSVLLKLTIEEPGQSNFTISLMNNNLVTGKYSFETRKGVHSYILRLSNQYAWHYGTEKYLFINSMQPKVTRVAFYLDGKS